VKGENTMMEEYQKMISIEEQMKHLKEKVEALTDRVVKLIEENNELKHINADLRSKNRKLQEDHDMVVAIADDLHAEQIALSKELDRGTEKCKVYTELYYELIGKLIAAKGESENV
jgi:regulator of replication initiation timing